MRLPLLAVVLLPLALTGCSDDAGPAAGPSSAPPTASPSQAPSPAPSATASPGVPAPSLPGIASGAAVPVQTPDVSVRLTGDGLDMPTRVLSFGDPLAAARPDLLRFLGTPSRDTGPIPPTGAYGTCPGASLRVLEYDGGALQLFFTAGTAGGAPALTSWSLTRESGTVPPARALVGDVTTFDFRPGDTVGDLQAGAGDAVVLAGDELVGPSFRLQDQSGGFFGTLTTVGPDGLVKTVQAGDGCES